MDPNTYQYDAVEMHRRMVDDHVRTEWFRAAIASAVNPGDVVLDVGAGSGILSLFAAAAGASRVIAVERSHVAAELATTIVSDNGLGDVIEVVASDIEHVTLRGPVDVIVSEWLGAYGIDENLLAPVLLARDRWLRDGGRLVPARTTTWIAPVAHPIAADAIRFHDRPYGLDLSAMAPHDLDQVVWMPDGLDLSHLRAEPARVWDIDLQQMPVAEATRPYAAEVVFELSAGGVNALAPWFTAEVADGGVLTNAPGAASTHWGHFLFPVVTASGLGAGDRLEIGFHNVPASGGGSDHLWSVHSGTTLLEAHDTRRLRRTANEQPWRVVIASGESSLPDPLA